MHNQRFFDQTMAMIENGELRVALPMLAGKLYNAYTDKAAWPNAREALLDHELHEVLLEDPYTAHCFNKPRGYAGDAGLIDIIYNLSVPGHVSKRGEDIFEMTIRFQAAEAVRQRRTYAEEMVSTAWRSGKRICSLACGHFREGDALISKDLSNITLVDQDAASLDFVRSNHKDNVVIQEANVFRYLRAAATRGDKFDLIYTLGLTDYLDARAMHLLHRLMKACLAPNGTIVVANFLTNHLGTGWMSGVMDWDLVYRDQEELAGWAEKIDMVPRTWLDATGSIAWCEMSDA